MSLDPHLPDWAVPGPAPAGVVKATDTRRTQDRHVIKIGQIPPGSITLAELIPGLVTTLGGALVPYGLLSAIGPTGDKQMYVSTNDGDGGTSSALWQYESGGFVRVGPPTKHASQHNAGGSDAMTVDAIAATGSLRTLGTGSQQAAPGNDTRLPVTGVLTADLAAIAAQTTLQNATGLGLSIGASATEIWQITYWLLVSAANITMDVKFGFTVPTACTMKGGGVFGTGQNTAGGWIDTAAANTPLAIATQATVIQLGTNAGTNGFLLSYRVFGGGTAGTVQLQYAQNTSDAGNLQLLKGSSFEAIKLAA